MHSTTLRSTRPGFSLIELMLVLASIAVILSVINLGRGTINTSRLSTMERDILTFQSAVTAWAAQQAPPTFAGVTVTLLKSSGVLPTGVSGNNPWGTAYTLTGTASGFTVSSDANTGSNCTALANRLALAAASASCVGSTVTVNF